MSVTHRIAVSAARDDRSRVHRDALAFVFRSAGIGLLVGAALGFAYTTFQGTSALPVAIGISGIGLGSGLLIGVTIGSIFAVRTRDHGRHHAADAVQSDAVQSGAVESGGLQSEAVEVQAAQTEAERSPAEAAAEEPSAADSSRMESIGAEPSTAEASEGAATAPSKIIDAHDPAHAGAPSRRRSIFPAARRPLGPGPGVVSFRSEAGLDEPESDPVPATRAVGGEAPPRLLPVEPRRRGLRDSISRRRGR